ncbi:MAG: two component transcriptional regulator, LuxR family [Acidobacteria bacterium]|nr:two component transcriptional regulator, LuxR family [Acidobacteriota bacterium]
MSSVNDDPTIRVLLADDHPIVLGGLDQLLSHEPDITVVARCTNGTDTLAAIAREHPAVVIADLTMPRKSGLDVLRELHTMRSPVRLVLLTARIEHEQVLEALNLGVAGIVLKESAPLQILDCIRRVAAGGQWIDQVIGSRTLDGVLRRQSGAMKAAAILTAREIEVVRMVARGLRNKEIADLLSITEGTVKAHLRTIFEKLRIDNRMKLIVYAREMRLV